MFRLGFIGVSLALVTLAIACGGDDAAKVTTGSDGGADGNASTGPTGDASPPRPDGSDEPTADGSSDDAGDAASSPDAATAFDAGPPCDPAKAFGTPTPITELNTAESEAAPRLSEDELTIYFDRGVTGSRDIFVAHRTSRLAAFGAPTALSGVNTLADEADPAVSADGKTLFFVSSVDGGGYELSMSTERDTDGNFINPTHLTTLDFGEAVRPYPRADGTELWFSTLGPRGILHASWSGTTFGTPAVESELTNGLAPVLSADALTIFFITTGQGTLTASRGQADAGFGTPKVLSELDPTLAQAPGWISPDGCRLYLERTAAGASKSDLWVAERSP